LAKKHDFDAAWKSILEAFEVGIVAAVIYTYKGERGKDKSYVYKLPEIENEILTYNFRIIDVEKIKLEKISDDNPLKLVFKMAKSLLETGARDEDIYEEKIKLSEELLDCDKVKNNDQIKALVVFLALKTLCTLCPGIIDNNWNS
jgi:hypothetical protein